MGSIVHRSVPTNLKWFPTCSHAHAMFQDRFKDVQVGSRLFSTLYILSPNFHTPARMAALITQLWPDASQDPDSDLYSLLRLGEKSHQSPWCDAHKIIHCPSHCNGSSPMIFSPNWMRVAA